MIYKQSSYCLLILCNKSTNSLYNAENLFENLIKNLIKNDQETSTFFTVK